MKNIDESWAEIEASDIEIHQEEYPEYSDDPATITHTYLSEYINPVIIDPNEEIASKVFSGAITYASMVFSNRLILGGAYLTNKDDKLIILEHLQGIMHVLEKYQKK